MQERLETETSAGASRCPTRRMNVSHGLEVARFDAMGWELMLRRMRTDGASRYL